MSDQSEFPPTNEVPAQGFREAREQFDQLTDSDVKIFGRTRIVKFGYLMVDLQNIKVMSIYTY